MNRKGFSLVIIICIIAVLVIVGAVGYSIWKNSATPIPAAPAEPTSVATTTTTTGVNQTATQSSSTANTSEWQTYTNNEDDYTIEYPANWFNLGDITGPQFSNSRSYAPGSSYFTIYRLAPDEGNGHGPANPSMLNIQQWFQQEYPSASSAATFITGTVTSVSSTKIISIGGHQAVQLIFLDPTNYEPQIVDYIANKTDVYTISYSGSPGEYTATYNAMLSTFQFFAPTSTVSVSSVTPTLSGDLYTNTGYNFQIVFPKGYTVYDGKYLENVSTYFGPRWDKNGDTSSTILAAASLESAGGEIDFSVWKDTSPGVMEACEQADIEDSLNLNLVTSSPESIGGLEFWPYVNEDDSMDGTQILVGYSVLHGGACYSLAVSMESPNGPGPTINTTGTVSILQNMLTTFKFLQ